MDSNRKKYYISYLLLIATILIFSPRAYSYNYSGKVALLTPISGCSTIMGTPTCTRHPFSDHDYYNKIGQLIREQKYEFQDKFGDKEGVKKTVDWLNKKLSEPPLPPELKESVDYASVDESEPVNFDVYLKSGLRWYFDSISHSYNEPIPKEKLGEYYIMTDFLYNSGLKLQNEGYKLLNKYENMMR